jgi:LDH2 family malate/lactate/ureidoglycolate dehydrogenase
LVEILSAVVTGAGMLSEVASWNLDMSSTNDAGHAFIAIDIAQIMDIDKFYGRIKQVITELKNAPKEKGKDTIFLPGEMEWGKYDKAEESGELELTGVMADNLLKLADKMGLEINIY